jgi:predicted ferric reductase
VSTPGEWNRNLRPVKEVCLKLPYGELFSGSNDTSDCIFIAGGTGITPFLSLFTDDSFAGYSNPRLYLGVKQADHNLYSAALDRALQINPELTVTVVVEESDGMLNIQSMMEECGESTWFISGPPLMITSFKQYLLEHGVNKDNVITDEWE